MRPPAQQTRDAPSPPTPLPPQGAAVASAYISIPDEPSVTGRLPTTQNPSDSDVEVSDYDPDSDEELSVPPPPGASHTTAAPRRDFVSDVRALLLLLPWLRRRRSQQQPLTALARNLQRTFGPTLDRIALGPSMSFLTARKGISWAARKLMLKIRYRCLFTQQRRRHQKNPAVSAAACPLPAGCVPSVRQPHTPAGCLHKPHHHTLHDLHQT